MHQFAGVAEQMMKTGYAQAELLAQGQTEQVREAQTRAQSMVADQMKMAEEVSETLLANTQNMWASWSDFAKSATERNLATFRKLATAKSPAEWSEIQLGAATEMAESVVKQTTSVSETVGKQSAQMSRLMTGYADKVAASVSK